MDALSEPGVDRIVLMTSAQIGKALSLDTPLPTPDGWTTMGAVKVGDTLFDENGFPCRVTAVSPVQENRDCYRVVFGDGSEIVADADHRWYVEPSVGRRGGPAVMTTAEILADLHTQIGSGRVRNNWSVPVSDGLDLPERNLPIDPYFLGLWLGDGHSASAIITAGDEDKGFVCQELERLGYVVDAKRDRTAWRLLVDPRESDGSHCRGYETASEYNLALYHNRKHGTPFKEVPEKRITMFSRLASAGLLKNKHVPVEYLRCSFKQRLSLLQGLMDSDGYASPAGHCEFCSTDKGLADSVFELSASLGFKPTMREADATIYGRVVSVKYRVQFKAYSEQAPFRLPRKLARLSSENKPGARSSETKRRFIKAIEKVASVPVKCVAIDSPSHLYLAGRSMIPTHNTEILNNIIGFHISQDPAPILVLQPTLEMAETWSKDRLSPMLRDTPCLKDKVADARSRDSGNTLLHKKFLGGHVTAVGANSAAGLASRPIRVVMADEVDRYPVSAGAEGDPLSLAIKRTTTFFNRRIVMCSTPTVKGISRIEAEFEKSDKRRYFVACPHCQHEQHLVWCQVRWPEGRPHEALYHCEECGAGWSDAERRAAIRWGQWRSTADKSSVVGFHINELYSPWSTVADVAQAFMEAKRSHETIKTWVNTSLGETWEEDADGIDANSLATRLEDWGDTVPQGVLMITAGIDVQDDRLHLEKIGWGVGEESWSLDYRVFYGDPSSPQIWKELTEYLSTPTVREDGVELDVRLTCIDSGGHHTQTVYKYARTARLLGVRAIKGVLEGPVFKISKNMTSAKNRLHLVGTKAAKDLIYARLKTEEQGPGYCHFPKNRDRSFFDELTAEVVKTKYVKGFPTRVYELPPSKRNEALDCRVYGFAALQMVKPSWGELLGANPPRRRRELPKPEVETPPPAAVARNAEQRKSSWLDRRNGWIR